MIMVVLLSSCAQIQSRESTLEGKIIDINFQELQSKINHKDSFILQFSKRDCPYCIELEKIEKDFLTDNNVIIYRYYPSENIEHYQDSMMYIQDYFSDLKYVPTVYWINKGIVADEMDRTSENQYKVLEEWIEEIDN